jgi:hypothetical protein
VRQSWDKSKFFLVAGADGPSDQFLYEMPGDGGPLTRISKAPGKHTAVLSPDERWVADIYSYSNKPPDLYIQETLPGQDLKRLTPSPSAEFGQYGLQDQPIVMDPARDGIKVPSRMYKRANYRKGGPAIIVLRAGSLRRFANTAAIIGTVSTRGGAGIVRGATTAERRQCALLQFVHRRAAQFDLG